jgi:two-component system phosphate regulon sensor histidine kinase PhoR
MPNSLRRYEVLVIAWPQNLKRLIIKRDNNSAELGASFNVLMDSLPWRFFRKLALMQILVSSLVIISTAWMARYYLKTYITTQAEEQLEESLTLIKNSIQTQNISPLNWCKSLKLNWTTRYTLINTQGRVLCDNYLKPELLENQLDYPEIQDALRFGFSSQIRFEQVAGTNMIYGAVSIDTLISGIKERYIIRQTVPLHKLDRAMKELDRSIFIFLFPLLILSSLVSLWGSLQVSSPLRSILKKVDRMKRVTKDQIPAVSFNPHDEWGIVEKTLDQAQEGLERYIEQLYNENEKMGTVMESITDSILAVGLDEDILFANHHFKKNFLSKVIKDKDILSFRIWEITNDIELQTLFNDCLLTGEPVKRRNIELPIKGGKRNSFFDVKVNPLFDQKGDIFGAVGVFHDVTERKLADQMREDFVANVSHEIRTPLTAIKGFTQVIKDTPPEDHVNVMPFLDKLEANADRLTTLFNDILHLSVIESKQKIAKESMHPQDLTDNVLMNVKQSYRQKKIVVHTEYDIEKVWVNPPFMEQVLTNLIENAYKYTPEEGELFITWKLSENKKWDILKIRDTGHGIPKIHHERLFERFYRVDSGRSREAGGTGLGLAIVKHIVSVHNGKISVESKEGLGTTFTVKIPAHY